MLNPDVLVRYYGVPTERVTNNPGSKTEPTWKAVKRPNGTTDYIQQPNENTYEKIQRAGEGYDLASAIARLEAGDTSIKAKSMVYTEGTDLENLPKDRFSRSGESRNKKIIDKKSVIDNHGFFLYNTEKIS